MVIRGWFIIAIPTLLFHQFEVNRFLSKLRDELLLQCLFQRTSLCQFLLSSGRTSRQTEITGQKPLRQVAHFEPSPSWFYQIIILHLWLGNTGSMKCHPCSYWVHQCRVQPALAAARRLRRSSQILSLFWPPARASSSTYIRYIHIPWWRWTCSPFIGLYNHCDTNLHRS